MKKQLKRLGFSLLILSAIAYTAFTPQEKEKSNQKKQEQDRGRKEERNNQGKNDIKNNKENKDRQDNNNNGHNDDYDQNNKEERDNKGKNEDNRNYGNNDRDNSYKWDRETFKDRNKIRNKDKVTICHKFNRNNEQAVTISVSSNALKAHMNHGDVMGNCPAVTDNRNSDIFRRKRNDYYDNLQQSQEQVVYSQSILDYALSRLANSRTQLATYQNNNMPLVDIQRKQATVLELEQNVSLLETLIGAAVNVLVNKLQ